MDANNLSNFSVLKAFNDNGKSVLDSLIPFVEYGLLKAGTEYIEFDELKKIITENCHLEIPSNTLKTLLKRLKRNDLITNYENWSHIQIVNKAKLNTHKYENQIKECQRDINLLILDCKKYCNFTKSDDDVLLYIYSFIELYQKYINFEEDRFDLDIANLPEDCIKIFEYVKYLSNCNNKLYNIFKSIFYGFILQQFIKNGINVENKKLKNLTVYLDSSFILRILDLQAPAYVLASKELLFILRDLNIKIITFSEVIDEVKAVINKSLIKYVKCKDELLLMHGESVKQLDGVIGAFFRKDFENSDILDYVNNIGTYLKNEKISILPNKLNQDLKVFDKEFDKIYEFKLHKNNIKDDLVNDETLQQIIKKKALLEARILNYIRFIRRGEKTTLDTSEHILLTCDNIVYKVNNYYHKDQNTIPECLNESRLTNTLFMYNSQLDSDISIKLFISIFQSSSYLDFEILRKFHKGISKYTLNNPSQQQYLGYLFSNQNLFEQIYDNEKKIDGDNLEESLLFKKMFEETENIKKHQVEISENEQIGLNNKIEILNQDLINIINKDKITDESLKIQINKNKTILNINTKILKYSIRIIMSLLLIISIMTAVPKIVFRNFKEFDNVIYGFYTRSR